MNRYRHEYKYLIDKHAESILLIKAAGALMPDTHTREDGSYFIRSLYFDDRQDSCLKENIEGTDPRSKFRIRYYNTDAEHLRLEKKSKVRGMTLKEVCTITPEECHKLMQGVIPEIGADMPSAKKKLLAEMSVKGLVPTVIVSYERIPFVYPGGNVRITFDRMLSSSVDIQSF